MNPTQDTLDLVMGALRTPDDRIAKTISTGTGLVPLHRGFDELIISGAEGRQRFGIDQHLDASGYAGVASDQPVAFEREHHLVDRRRRHLKESLQIGFGRRPAEHQCVGVNKGQVLPLLGCEAGFVGGET
jgi:hypothetical protein